MVLRWAPANEEDYRGSMMDQDLANMHRVDLFPLDPSMALEIKSSPMADTINVPVQASMKS